MATNRYIPRTRHNPGKHLALQCEHMRKHFPCFTCSLRHGLLECFGEITPSEECDTYRIRIRLPRGGTPKVRVLNPKIQPGAKIHTYANGDLCLFDHREQPWMEGDNLHEKIVPWTSEWLVYYELYQLTGQWLGPEAPHGDTPKVAQLN
jgi:hypothetical protein